jgi:hypothetical protein
MNFNSQSLSGSYSGGNSIANSVANSTSSASTPTGHILHTMSGSSNTTNVTTLTSNSSTPGGVAGSNNTGWRHIVPPNMHINTNLPPPSPMNHNTNMNLNSQYIGYVLSPRPPTPLFQHSTSSSAVAITKIPASANHQSNLYNTTTNTIEEINRLMHLDFGQIHKENLQKNSPDEEELHESLDA